MEYSGLIVGLGNPGGKYSKTRHNLGFMAADELARLLSDKGFEQVSADKKNNKYILSAWDISGCKWLLCKPLTYMNLSGRAVQSVAHKHSLSPGKILIIHDELDLPFQSMRYKQGGGLAGHRGLKSAAEHLGSREFNRLRLGIGRPLHSDASVVDYVLSRFAEDEAENLPQLFGLAAKSLLEYCLNGIEAAREMLQKACLES